MRTNPQGPVLNMIAPWHSHSLRGTIVTVISFFLNNPLFLSELNIIMLDILPNDS